MQGMSKENIRIFILDEWKKKSALVTLMIKRKKNTYISNIIGR